MISSYVPTLSLASLDPPDWPQTPRREAPVDPTDGVIAWRIPVEFGFGPASGSARGMIELYYEPSLMTE